MFPNNGRYGYEEGQNKYIYERELPVARMLNGIALSMPGSVVIDMRKSEEITWDYETTEYISISIAQCFCGSKFCRKVLRGFKYLPILTIIKYNGFIADYLKKDAAYQYFSKGYIQKTIVSRYI